MIRNCVDLHLCVNVKNLEKVSRVTSKASKLGYKLIAMPFLPNSKEEIQNLKNMCKIAGIDLVSRVDIKPRTARELIYNLRRLRRKFEIISVLCESKEVARQAAKDRRVDLLTFPSLSFRKRFFDRAEAELASNSLASLEIGMKPLLVLEGLPRIKHLSTLRREAATAQEFHVPIVISSGVSDELFLRKPRELAALASLFDLDKTSALDAISKNPSAIVKRNREKLSASFIAPGIRIIRGGKSF